MKLFFSELKERIISLKNTDNDPEFTDRTLKGERDANRYLCGMCVFFLFLNIVLLVLSVSGVITVVSPLLSALFLGGAILCQTSVLIIGKRTDYAGRQTPRILIGLTLFSCAFISLWLGDYAYLIFALPIFLAVRYCNFTFSAIVGLLIHLFVAVSTFVGSFVGGVAYATIQERLHDCFDMDFFICAGILAICNLSAMFCADGGRRMIHEEAEMLAAQTKIKLEMTEAKTQLMISQIQPHFIYNTLNTICYLCDKEPKTAQNALSDFSDYLRENLNFSGKAEMIPFEREMAHVEKYLSLEKMRFEEELNYETDIGCSCFKLPALTVQPLVENAVKHGICHRDGGGTVKIKTREDGEYFVIQISDDGVGFDPEQPLSSDSRRHIGLDNTRTRLAQMCNAKMKVESAVGQGTTITIDIPKEFYYDNSRS